MEYFKEHGDVLTIGFDGGNDVDQPCMIVSRRVGDEIHHLQTYYGDQAVELYEELSQMGVITNPERERIEKLYTEDEKQRAEKLYGGPLSHMRCYSTTFNNATIGNFQPPGAGNGSSFGKAVVIGSPQSAILSNITPELIKAIQEDTALRSKFEDLGEMFSKVFDSIRNIIQGVGESLSSAFNALLNLSTKPFKKERPRFRQPIKGKFLPPTYSSVTDDKRKWWCITHRRI